MFAIIQAAGWPIWPLLIASIIAVALIIERMISLREGKIVPPTLLDQVIAVHARQGVNTEVVDKLAKLIPFELGITLDDALDTVKVYGYRTVTAGKDAQVLARFDSGSGQHDPAHGVALELRR